MNKYQNRYDNALIAFEIVSALAVVILGGWYYFTPSSMKIENSQIKPLPAEILVASSSILSESNVVKKATSSNDTIVTAYIKEINGDKITLDYFDLLGGDEAKKAIVEDGKCTQQEIDSDTGCFNNGIVYFRNQNPKLRILTLSPDVRTFRTSDFSKSSDGTTEILVKELKMQYSNKIYRDGQGVVSLPYRITLNSDNEVIKIEEIFRP
jgi:hypothetical protein